MTDIRPPDEESDQLNTGQVMPAAQTEQVAPPNDHPAGTDSVAHESSSTDKPQKPITSSSTQELIRTTASNIKNSDNQRISTQSSHHQQQLQAVEQRLLKAKRDLESMVLKYAKSEQENLQNKMKVDDLDKKLKRAIKDNDQLANRIKLLSNDKKQLTDTLSSKVAQLTVLEQKSSCLNSVQAVKLKEYEEKITRLESSNAELEKQAEDHKSKQTELKDFSERLSLKHMMLQTELDDALSKVPHYKEQHENSLKERDTAIQQRELLSEQIDTLSESLINEQKLTESLQKAFDEEKRNYQTALDEHENEIKMMRRKHHMATRELMKEIKQLQARLGEIQPLKQQDHLQINA